MEDYTSTLSHFAEKLCFSDIPTQTLDRLRMFVADYCAACFAGYRVNRPFNRAVLSLIRSDAGTGEASILGESQKYPASTAAYMNAIYAHGADMDDGNRKAAGHIGTHVMPAVFALAEKERSAWEDVLTALLVGYEFFNRIVGAAQPSLYHKGFHSTGVGGSLACAAACAKLLGLDAKGIQDAVALAAVQSSGLILIDESGQACKPLNPANAAKLGLFSAQLAQKGVDAPQQPLESRKGWFHAFSDAVDEHILLDGLGQRFTIEESYLKLYPSCRHTHSVIDGARELRLQLLAAGYRLDAVEDVRIFIYPNAIKSAGNISLPINAGEAKFSIHYAFAAALQLGNFRLQELDPQPDAELLSLIGKVRLIPDESMENRSLGLRGSKISLTTQDHRQFEVYVPIPRGEGDLPLRWEELREKMLFCADGLLTESALDSLLAQCRELGRHQSFCPLFPPLIQGGTTLHRGV